MKMYLLLLPLLFLPFPLLADNLPLNVGGFIDTYYAYDINRPNQHERLYTTQPARHNEFNVNLAFLETSYKDDSTRGRLAVQMGNSVDKNTEGEPRLGRTSGANASKYLQEALVGRRLGPKTWVDAGIYLGHIGAESWISKENWTYTRALNLDYVPYYSAGVRFTHEANDTQSFQLHLMNGWQNVSENNEAKAIGLQFNQQLNERWRFTYNNFFGDEKVVPNRDLKFHSRFRGYHNFILRWLASEEWQFLTAVDFGHQAQQENDGIDGWFASTLTIRRVLSETQSLALRLESYQDPQEANVTTIPRKGFEVVGASLNYDQGLSQNTLWRTELRGFRSQHKIYPARGQEHHRGDAFLVTSLSLWF